MKMVRPLGLALLIALAACSKKSDTVAPVGPIAAVAPPAGKQWTDIVSQTDLGGMRIGNPDAPVKIVEYASYTCPHCKHFEDEGADPLLQKYVSTGKVSWEFRSLFIHGTADVMMTVLMNCRGPSTFFPLAKQVYAAQDDWVGKLSAMSADQQKQLQNEPPAAQFKAMAEAGDLYGFFGVRGLPRAQADACFDNQAMLDKMTAWQQHATDVDQVDSTPTFFINGTKQADVASWAQLETQLTTILH